MDDYLVVPLEQFDYDIQRSLYLLKRYILSNGNDRIEWEIGKERDLFHPMACIKNYKNLYIYNRPGENGPGTKTISLKLCWGFLGANEFPIPWVEENRSIINSDFTFTPYSNEAAEICQRAKIDGLNEWIIPGPNGSEYKVSNDFSSVRRKDTDPIPYEGWTNTFIQRNISNPRLARIVVCIDEVIAKKLVLRSLYPELKSSIWSNSFPIEQYDKMFLEYNVVGSLPYKAIVEQVRYTHIFDDDDAYDILYRNYPGKYATLPQNNGIRIQF